MSPWYPRSSALLVSLSLACGEGSPSAPNTVDTLDTSDAVDTSDASGDTDAPGDADSIEDAADSTDTEAPTDVDDHGFHIRVPQVRSVPSEDFEGTIRVVDQVDIDHVCQLDIDGRSTFLYVQANPVRCRDFGGCEYEVVGAFTTVAEGPVNAPLAGVTYDFGGNHHNDAISLPSAEGTLKIYHSSFGFGWRACLPPDCVQVLDGDAVIADGCTPERLRPAICVLIGDDGSEPPLIDTFEPCPGDPNRP